MKLFLTPIMKWFRGDFSSVIILMLLISACGEPTPLGETGGGGLKPTPKDYTATLTNLLQPQPMTAGQAHPLRAVVEGLVPANGTIRMNLRALVSQGSFVFYADQALSQRINSLEFDHANNEKTFYIQGTRANQTLTIELEDDEAFAELGLPIQAAAVDRMTIRWNDTAPTTDTALSGEVTIFDQYDNIAQYFSGRVVIETSETNATCSGRNSLNHLFSPNQDRGVFQFNQSTLGFCTTGSKSLSARSPTHSQLSSVSSNFINVSAGGVSRYIVSGPNSGPTNTNLSYTAIAEDQYGNRNFDYNRTGVFQARLNSGNWIQFAANQAFQNGQVNFSGRFSSTGTWQVRASENGNPTLNGIKSTNIQVQSYYLVTEVLGTAPFRLSHPSSPNPVSVRISVKDNNNRTGANVNFTGQIQLISSDQNIDGQTISFSNQGSRTVSVHFHQLGSVTLQASASRGFGPSVNTTTIPGAPAQATISGITTQAYVPHSAQVTIQDGHGNLITGRQEQIRYYSTFTGFDLTRASNANTGVATFSNIRFRDVASGAVKVVYSGNEILSQSVTTTPGPLHRVAPANWPSSARLNQTRDFRVNFLDEGGHATVVPGGSMSLTSTPSNLIEQRSNQGFSNTDHATFTNVRALTFGNGSIIASVSAGTFNGQTQPQNFSVQAGAPSRIRFKTLVPQWVAGNSDAIEVEVLDSAGNPTNANGGSVTLNYSRERNPDTPSVNSSGVARQTGVRFERSGALIVSASYPGVSDIQQQISVGPGSLSQIIASAPQTVNVGVAFPISIELQDAFGNRKTDYTGAYQIYEGSSVRGNGSFTLQNQGLLIHQQTLNNSGQNRQFYVRVGTVNSPVFSINVTNSPALADIGMNFSGFGWIGENYSVSAVINDRNGNGIANRQVELISNANGFSRRVATTNSQGVATFNNVQFTSAQENVFLEVRDSLVTSVKARKEGLTICQVGQCIAYNSFLPPATNVKGARLFQAAGFPVNIDIADTRLPNDLDLAQTLINWDSDLANPTSPTYTDPIFSHTYDQPGDYTIRVSLVYPGSNVLNLDIPVTVFSLSGMTQLYVSSVNPNASDAGSNTGQNQSQPLASIAAAQNRYHTLCQNSQGFCPVTINVEGVHDVQTHFNIKQGPFIFRSWPGTSNTPVIRYHQTAGVAPDYRALFSGEFGRLIEYFKIEGTIRFEGDFDPSTGSARNPNYLAAFHNGNHHVFRGDQRNSIQIDGFLTSYYTANSVRDPATGNQVTAAPATTRNSVKFINIQFEDHIVSPIATGATHLVIEQCHQLNGSKTGPGAPMISLYGAYRSLFKDNLFWGTQPLGTTNQFNEVISIYSVASNYLNASTLDVFFIQNEFYNTGNGVVINQVGSLSTDIGVYGAYFLRNTFWSNADSNPLSWIKIFNKFDRVVVQNSTFQTRGSAPLTIALELRRQSYPANAGVGSVRLRHNSFNLAAPSSGSPNTVIGLLSDHGVHSGIQLFANSFAIPGNHQDQGGYETGFLQLTATDDTSVVVDADNLTFYTSSGTNWNREMYRFQNQDYTDQQWATIGGTAAHDKAQGYARLNWYARREGNC